MSENDAKHEMLLSAAQSREATILKSLESLQALYEKKCEEYSISTPRCEPCGSSQEEEEREEDWYDDEWEEADNAQAKEEEEQEEVDVPILETGTSQEDAPTPTPVAISPTQPFAPSRPFGPHYKENEEVKIAPITHKQADLQDWIDNSIKSVMSASGRRNLAKKWMDAVLTAKDYKELVESPERAEQYGNFDSLCGKFGLALQNQLKGHLEKKITNIEIANKKETGDFLNGQQIFLLVLDHLRNDDKADKTIKDQQDLMALELLNDNLQGYQNALDTLLLKIDKQPEEDTMFFLYTEQIKRSSEIREEWKFREILREREDTVDTFLDAYRFVDHFLADKFKEDNKLTKQSAPRQPKWTGGAAAPAPHDNTPKYQKDTCSNYYWHGACSTQYTTCPWSHTTTINLQGKGGRGRGRGKGKGKSKGNDKGKGDGKDKSKGKDKSAKGKEKDKGKGKDEGKDKGKDGGKKRGRSDERSSSTPKRGASPSGQPDRPLCWKGDYCPGIKDKSCGFWHPGNCKV